MKILTTKFHGLIVSLDEKLRKKNCLKLRLRRSYYKSGNSNFFNICVIVVRNSIKKKVAANFKMYLKQSQLLILSHQQYS